MAQLIKGVVDTQIENLIPIGSTNAGDDTVIELSIKSNGQDFIFNNPTFELLSKKEDNTKTRQIKDITLLDGKVKIKADIQLTLCKGIVTNQLIINDGDKISTVYFYFMVNPSLENEVLEESKDKIESLDKLDKLINTSFSDLEAYENKLLAFSAEMDSIVEVESKREANELIRSTSEVKRISNEDSRIISEEDRIANEAIRVENEEARGLAESERVTNENNRRLAENTRKTQENARVAAEEQRQSIFEENENIRKEQEDNRVQAERIRKNKFDIWEEREGIRLISEDQRRESEEARQVSESNRDKAEKVREQQEANRQLTYNRFNSGEEERVNNENSRKDKENLRVLAENSRVAAEEERVAAENTRNSRYETAESNRNNTFNSNENKRQSDYESNEGTRNSTFEAEERKRKNSYQDAENTRNNSFNQQEENRQNEYTVAERLRVENENLRKNNEVTRGSNEEIRKSNETSRVSSENIRVENENTRVAAEQKRQEDFKNIQSQYEHIVTENNNFKTKMDTDFGNAKTDYFGEEHLNVVNRLNSDFDNVHQRINDSSYLEYSGANIKADKSYFGLTKDLSVKGRTLQNLIKAYNNFYILKGSCNSGVIELNQQAIDSTFAYLKENLLIKENTTYTLIVEVIENTIITNDGSFSYSLSIGRRGLGYGDWALNTKEVINVPLNTAGIFRTTATLDNITTGNGGRIIGTGGFVPKHATNPSGKIRFRILLLEGDHTNTPISDIPFGEGIYSVGENENNLIDVKSCGKNLFKFLFDNPNYGASYVIDNDCITVTTKQTTNYANCRTNKFNLKKGKYTISYNGELISSTGFINMSLRDANNINNSLIGDIKSGVPKTFTIDNDIDVVLILYSSSVLPTVGESVKYSNIQLEENTSKTTYSPYQESILNYQLKEPLRSLPTNIYDEIFRDELIKRVKKDVLNGGESWELADGSKENTIRFSFIPSTPFKKSVAISDKFQFVENSGIDSECFTVATDRRIHIRIMRNKLSEVSVLGFKKWLQQNRITVYYELAEPIVTKLSKKAELKTFDEVTHFTSNNLLVPNLSVKVPSNVQAVLQDTRARNRELENELETTTLKLKEADNILKEMDTDLIKTNWEMDDRLFEVEWALEDAGLVTPVSTFNINNKMRGSASVMALSKFEQAKIIIMSGDYDRVTLEGQLSKYLKRNIIAQDEYDTLISMMDAKEIVVGE